MHVWEVIEGICLREHVMALKTAASQYVCWHTGCYRGEWEWVLRRNCQRRGSSGVNFFMCRLIG